ncbi:hypothetical protein TWF694_005007 [Orbilia ellipsospora]|uniref:Phosphatidylinositol diacylglycerol-lyase n=1 Tax=Orbilia ellipsospora TaxID=2528407 RepID=A0AAV9WVW2_9PEZI
MGGAYSTTRSYLESINLTPETIKIYANDGDNYDWDNSAEVTYRPDHNFRDVEIKPFERASRPCETNNAAKTSTIHMKITIETGDHKANWIYFESDQKDAFTIGDGVFAPVAIKEHYNPKGAKVPTIKLYQVAFGDYNRYIVVPDSNPARWMEHLPDDTRLFDMLLPGTHDSGCIVDRGGTALSWTQAADGSTISDQLAAGIRVFDLRFRLKNGELITYHGIEDMNYAGVDIMNEIFKFLKSDKKEFVLAKIRAGADVAPKLWDAIKNSKYGDCKEMVFNASMKGAKDWVNDGWPETLKDCRGKLVIQVEDTLMTEFGGIRLPWWNDSTKDQTISSGNKDIRVQDEYKYTVGLHSQKWTSISNLLKHQETGAGPRQMWYYNFLNASGRVFPNAWSNGSGVDWGMNRRLMAYWAENTYFTTGVMWLDYFREPMGMNALPVIMAAMNNKEIRDKYRK